MRLPVNVYNFNVKIFKIDIFDFLLLFLGICMFIFMSSISIYLSIPGLIIILIIIIVLKNKKRISIILSKAKNDNILYFQADYKNSFYNIDKEEKFSELSKDLNTIDCISFILEPYIDENNYYYKLIIGINKNDVGKLNAFKINERLKLTRPSPKIIKKRYYIDNLYKSVFYLYDSGYGSDLLYASIIYSLNIPVEIIIHSNSVNNKIIKSLLVSRKAELKRLKSSDLISKHIEILNGFIRSENKIFDVSIKFIVYGSDPLNLKFNCDIFKNAMERLGLNVKNLDYYNKKSISINYIPYKYMMDSMSLSEIVPGGISKGSGVTIGIDLLNKRPVFLDIFNGISYNVVISGQTGSGKTFLAGKFIDYYKSDAFIYIIDPLNEYNFVDSKIIYDDEIKYLNSTDNHLNIIKFRYLLDINTLRSTLIILSRICSERPGKKIIIIDEAYNIIKSDINEIDDLIRNARHYNTSVINISQNFSDFSKRFSILNNSDSIFIFKQKEKIELMNISIDCSGLAGGNNNNYSECFLIRNREIIKIRI